MRVSRENFYKILDTIKVGLSRNKSLESMLYFQFTGDSIMAYNNQILITYKFKTDFTCFVHADNLMKIVNKLKDKEIDISLSGDKFLIKTKTDQLKLAIIEDTEIEERTSTIISTLEECKWYSIPENFFESAQLCQFAASKSESDNTLQCISIEGTEMTASDNSRIARAILKKKMKTMLLKAEFIPVIVRLNITKYDVSKSWIHFKADDENFVLSVRRIEGTFPDFSSILDSINGDTLELSDRIIKGLDLSEIFMDEFNSSVNIKISKGMCIVTTTSDAGTMTSRSGIEYKGKDFSFFVNPAFLKEMLNHSSTLEHSDDKIGITSGDFTIVTALFGER